MSQPIPSSAVLWLQSHQAEIGQLKFTQPSDREKFDELSEEYQKQFQRNLSHDLTAWENESDSHG